MSNLIQIRRGTSQEWVFANPILRAGEPGLETDTRRVKYGNGVDRWEELSYTTSEAVSVGWESITSKPSTFPATAHSSSHATGGSDAISPADIGAQPAGNYSVEGHGHAIADVTGLESSLASKANAASLSNVATSGNYSDLAGLPVLGTAAATNATDYATAAQGSLADSAVQPAELANYATANHSHEISNVTGLQEAIDANAAAAAAAQTAADGAQGTATSASSTAGAANLLALSNETRIDNLSNGVDGILQTYVSISGLQSILTGYVQTSDARLSDARTPTAHKGSHATGGSDALTPADIGAAPAESPAFTGAITVSATTGVAGSYAPSLSFVNDANTGFGSVASDTASIFTAGSERLRVNSNGSIGVGFAGSSSVGFRHHWNHTGNNYISHLSSPQIYSSASDSWNFWTAPSLKDSDYAYSSHTHFVANPIPSVPEGSTMGLEKAYVVGPSILPWSVQGFVGQLNTVSGQDRHNVYCSGSAPNYFRGKVGLGSGNTTPTAALDINDDKIRLRTAKTPASASDTGNAGDICWDSSYIYVCVATNTWRRIAHSAW